jgi:hypothetical protein
MLYFKELPLCLYVRETWFFILIEGYRLKGGVEKKAWIKEGGSNMRLEKTA